MNIKHNNIGKTPTNITNTGNNKIKKSESIMLVGGYFVFAHVLLENNTNKAISRN